MVVSTEARPVAVVCDRADTSAMQAFLESRGWSGEWHRLGELDHVDCAVRARQVGQVVFMRGPDLLEAIWAGQVDFQAWMAAGVHVEFVEVAGAKPAAWFTMVAEAWRRYRAVRRRQNAFAGLVLSAVAIIAAFLVRMS